MRDLPDHSAQKRPIGYFVHHQGRGHAERCSAIARALPEDRPLTIFCARDDIFDALPPRAEIIRIPSLFEDDGTPPRGMDRIATPDTLHCAPLGWAGIRHATARITQWFAQADPALMVSDVSAEIAQLSRICSVPHVKILQHGDRSDPGHMAAYDGAAGLLAPFDAALAQPDWSEAMRRKTHFAGGLGVDVTSGDRAAARKRLGIGAEQHIVFVLSGGGGRGVPEAPLSVGARATPDSLWLVAGAVAGEWHATPPANLRRLGWIDNVAEYLAAADVVISSTGNTTCAQVLAMGRPWLVIPEWRYFDEQAEKARALGREGLAVALPDFPASAQNWRTALRHAQDTHRPDRQRAMIDPAAADKTAAWIEYLIARLWAPLGDNSHNQTEKQHA